jgi:hypothetical protein
MLRHLKRLFTRKPFELEIYSGNKEVFASKDSFTGFAGDGFNYYSEHPLGLIKASEGLKVGVDGTNPIGLNLYKALIITPHNFFDTEDYLKRRLTLDYSLNSPEHLNDLKRVLVEENLDGVVIDGFRNLPQSFYNRTFSKRRTAIGLFSWDCVLISK